MSVWVILHLSICSSCNLLVRRLKVPRTIKKNKHIWGPLRSSKDQSIENKQYTSRCFSCPKASHLWLFDHYKHHCAWPAHEGLATANGCGRPIWAAPIHEMSWFVKHHRVDFRKIKRHQRANTIMYHPTNYTHTQRFKEPHHFETFDLPDDLLKLEKKKHQTHHCGLTKRRNLSSATVMVVGCSLGIILDTLQKSWDLWMWIPPIPSWWHFVDFDPHLEVSYGGTPSHHPLSLDCPL